MRAQSEFTDGITWFKRMKTDILDIMETNFRTLSSTYTGMNRYAFYFTSLKLRTLEKNNINNTHQRYITVCAAVTVICILNLNIIININN